ncbi:MAG: hypothetical protein LBT46_00850 [Planctomycetaceae bacterium]|jgi:hypothetical protein|nr:hypothetical protein [Planctomycetaceae bacterium]
MTFSPRHFRTKVLTGVTLGVYLFALVFLPVLHVHGGGCHSEQHQSCCHTEDTTPDCVTAAEDENCPFCEFLHLTVPLFALPAQIDLSAAPAFEPPYAVLIAPVAAPTGLPPSRAPPSV